MNDLSNRQPCPSGKVSFQTRAKAQKLVRRKSTKPYKRVYQCKRCGFYHLTKQSKARS